MNVGSVDDLQWSMRRLSWQDWVLRSLVEIFPGLCAVETAYTRVCHCFGLHHTRLHAHLIALVARQPKSHPSANRAAVELNPLRPEHENVSQSARNDYILGRVVGPQRAVAPAKRAVAIRDFVGSATNREADCSANTG